MESNVRVVLNYIEAINAADIHVLYDLMSEGFLFIDAHDNRVVGRDKMQQSWKEYFLLFPDYQIEVSRIVQDQSFICMLGYASGTYKNLKNDENSNHWKIPSAWTAIIKDDKVSQWQVYADNIVVLDIIRRNM